MFRNMDIVKNKNDILMFGCTSNNKKNIELIIFQNDQYYVNRLKGFKNDMDISSVEITSISITSSPDGNFIV